MLAQARRLQFWQVVFVAQKRDTKRAVNLHFDTETAPIRAGCKDPESFETALTDAKEVFSTLD